MSTDLKNSILLWVGAIVFAGLLWATLRFDFLPDIPPKLFWPLFGAMLLLNLLRFAWDIWRRRKAEKS